MPKSSAVAAAGLLCLMIQTAVAHEQPGGPQAQSASIQRPTGVTQAQKTATKTKLFGTVRSVDATNREIVVKTETGKTKKITLSAGTQLDKGSNHKEVMLADIKLGDPISIIMEGKVVRTIHVFLTPK
ncbi:MAG: hypothetical protein NTY77_06970 [Elusimicrobia bacterium]|nr:hypothetical protein [Elusimicrobiota bacterium]